MSTFLSQWNDADSVSSSFKIRRKRLDLLRAETSTRVSNNVIGFKKAKEVCHSNILRSLLLSTNDDNDYFKIGKYYQKQEYFALE